MERGIVLISMLIGSNRVQWRILGGLVFVGNSTYDVSVNRTLLVRKCKHCQMASCVNKQLTIVQCKQNKGLQCSGLHRINLTP